MFTVETKDGTEHAEFYSKEAAFDFMNRIGRKYDVTLKIKRDDKEETHIESRYKGTDFRLIDTYGDALILDVYTMKSTGERRIQLSLDNEDGTVRDMIEEHDIAVDINFETLSLLLTILKGVK